MRRDASFYRKKKASVLCENSNHLKTFCPAVEKAWITPPLLAPPHSGDTIIASYLLPSSESASLLKLKSSLTSHQKAFVGDKRATEYETQTVPTWMSCDMTVKNKMLQHQFKNLSAPTPSTSSQDSSFLQTHSQPQNYKNKKENPKRNVKWCTEWSVLHWNRLRGGCPWKWWRMPTSHSLIFIAWPSCCAPVLYDKVGMSFVYLLAAYKYCGADTKTCAQVVPPATISRRWTCVLENL